MLSMNPFTMKNGLTNLIMKIGLYVAIIIIGIAPLHAQESLTLAQALELGLDNNFGIKIEKERVAISKNNNNWGEAGRMPLLNVGINQNNNINDIIVAASPFQPTGQIISNNLNPNVNLNWVIFESFKVNMNKSKLALLQEQSAGNEAIVVENTMQAIILAYYTVLLEEERLDVLQKVLTLSHDKYNMMQMRKELGNAVTFDILQVKNNYLTDSTNLIRQTLNVKNAKRNLNLLLGQDVEKRLDLADSLKAYYNEYSFDELYTKLSANNNTLQNQYINQSILKNEINIQKTALFPRLSIDVGGNYTAGVTDNTNANFKGDFDNLGSVSTQTGFYYANFTLSYTLFNGGRVKRQIKNAKINEQIGQLQLEDMKLSLKNDLLSAYDLYKLREELIAISQENLETAELNLQIGSEKYKNGTINSFNYRDLQVNYLNSALSFLQANYDLIESNTELMRLAGEILDVQN